MTKYEPFPPYLSEAELAAMPLQIEAATQERLKYMQIKAAHKRAFDSIFSELQLNGLADLEGFDIGCLDPATVERLATSSVTTSAALGLQQEQEKTLGIMQDDWFNGLRDFVDRDIALTPRSDEPIRAEAVVAKGSRIVFDRGAVRGRLLAPPPIDRYDYQFRLRLDPDRRTKRRNKTRFSVGYYIDVLSPTTGRAQFDLSFE